MAVHLEAIDSISESKRAESIGQFDLFGGGEVSGSISTVVLDIPRDEWEKALLLNYEREMLGLYVSDHPLLGVEHVLRSVRDIPISQLFDENIAHESIFTVAGLITNVQRKVSRQGSNWAIVTVEDLEGAIDVLFFANTYQQHALSLIEDRIVTIRGRVDKREDTPRFTALDMSIPNVNQAPIGPFIIRIESERCTPPLVDRMKEILRSHPGTREVHLRIEGTAKETTFRLDDGLRVTASPSLSADLKSILGPDCLV